MVSQFVSLQIEFFGFACSFLAPVRIVTGTKDVPHCNTKDNAHNDSNHVSRNTHDVASFLFIVLSHFLQIPDSVSQLLPGVPLFSGSANLYFLE
jgi:hypothetical protein